MKTFPLILAVSLAASSLVAQSISDQNPRYAESRDKYMANSDTLLTTQGTTVQNTYKAYDWSQMREDHQFYRKDRRNDRRMMRAQAPRIIGNQWGLNGPGRMGWYRSPFGYTYNNWNWWW